ncbi:MAG TPA: SRPBCC family protein [Nitrospirota bacterium]|nr:SRPBCC family protein [Nitrospirota bacterium]
MVNHHFVTVNASADRLYPEILAWGESAWWPADSPMRYTRLTGGGPCVGAKYRQKVMRPFGPEWEAEIVSANAPREVTWRFTRGMFTGVYHLYIIPDEGFSEVHFMMDYGVRGFINRLMWRLVFHGKHDLNMRKILAALKAHVEGKAAGDAPPEPAPSREEADRRQFLAGILGRK